jgi:hypothetical protein
MQKPSWSYLCFLGNSGFNNGWSAVYEALFQPTPKYHKILYLPLLGKATYLERMNLARSKSSLFAFKVSDDALSDLGERFHGAWWTTLGDDTLMLPFG